MILRKLKLANYHALYSRIPFFFCFLKGILSHGKIDGGFTFHLLMIIVR